MIVIGQNLNDIQFANSLDNDVAIEISNEHNLLRDKLVKHLDLQDLNGRVGYEFKYCYKNYIKLYLKI